MAWPYFLFSNGFETGLQPKEKGKSLPINSSTPRSGRRRRRAISPTPVVEQPPSSSKTKKVKRNLDFSEKGQEAETHNENILNLPYSYSEEEQEEGADLALQIVAVTKEIPSPTPKEQEEPAENTSSRNPKTQKINKLLRQIYEMDIL